MSQNLVVLCDLALFHSIISMPEVQMSSRAWQGKYKLDEAMANGDYTLHLSGVPATYSCSSLLCGKVSPVQLPLKRYWKLELPMKPSS